jgi:carbon-monoxide dehydrogenase small subunit
VADAPVASVRFVLNGRDTSVRSHPMARLLDVLRHELHLTGTKEGCGEGECGACSVLVNGELANSCLLPVLQVAGTSVTTIEGVASDDGLLHAVQQAFIEHGGAQCGICTPGMVLAAVNLLDRHPQPTDEEIRIGLAGNLCRCTGYMRIFESVRSAARVPPPREASADSPQPWRGGVGREKT